MHPTTLPFSSSASGRLAAGLLCSAGALGCGDASDAGAADGQPRVGPTFEAGPFTVAPGEELVMCTYVRADTDTAEDVTVFTTEQTPGGHHLIVYTVDHAVDLPPSPCNQGGQPGWSQILVTQLEHDEQAFPEGVGFRVAAHQQYVMETHYINTTAEPLTVTSGFGVTYGAPGTVTQRAATYFFGTMNIDVAANAAGTSSVSCTPPEPMALRTMFGHVHRWGTGVDVSLARAGGAEEDVYQSDEWEDPPIARFEGGLELGTSDAVRVACDWQNGSAASLRYPQEMCFAIGYFWPAETGVICVSGGRKDECECRYQGDQDSGPGGAEVNVSIRRKAEIDGAGGALDAGAPIYCAMFIEDDWAGITPVEGAQPRYFRDVVDQPMHSAEQALTLAFQDVTPGDYKLTCMMDTIGGGWIPGSGDVLSLNATDVHVEAGQAAQAEVLLDFAMP
jgi:hypothetical protein